MGGGEARVDQEGGGRRVKSPSQIELARPSVMTATSVTAVCVCEGVTGYAHSSRGVARNRKRSMRMCCCNSVIWMEGYALALTARKRALPCTVPVNLGPGWRPGLKIKIPVFVAKFAGGKRGQVPVLAAPQ